MVLSLPPGEPAAGPWRVAPVTELVRLLGTGREPTGRPLVVAVDGRGGGGKSTVAERLRAAVASAVVVDTDDLAWHESFFGWEALLVEGVLEPVHRGEAVHFRPPAWTARGRPGAVEVPAGAALVVVEGVGAAQRAVAHLLDAVVWVQSDFGEAERRGIARDVAAGVNGGPDQTVAFWHEWMAQELTFQGRERPWERADVVVCGTPEELVGAHEVVLADGPLGAPGR